MNIAIDIDDTIYFLSKRIDKLTQKYLKLNKLNYKPIKEKYYLEERYPDLKMDNSFTTYLYEHRDYLYNRNMKKEIRKSLVDIMRFNKVYFLTNRSEKWLQKPYGFTFYWLCKNLDALDYNDLIINVKDKGKVAKELNCKVLIDNDGNILNKAKGDVKYRINFKDKHTIHEYNVESNGIITMTTWTQIRKFINWLSKREEI